MFFSLRGIFLISFIGILICGCSGNSSQPVSPDNSDSSSGPILSDARDANSTGTNHYLMNYGYIFVDPDHPNRPQFEVIPVRGGEVHFNVLKLLEINPCKNCFSVVAVDFPEPGKLNVYIKIDHPFDNLDASVFDVRAILMFQGNHEFPTAGKTISDPALGDGVLLNPDGYTALYNGSTLATPAGEFEKYFPGKLATPVVPDSEINGYKYFISDDPLNNRNAFYAGSSDVQIFSLQLTTGWFVIGYAVDASMLPATTSPVDDPLTDFDLNANCAEPWKVDVTEEPVGEGLTNLGGQTKLLIDVYDWQGKSTHHEPVVECPEIFDGSLTGTWLSDEVDYTRYEVTVSNDNLAPYGNYLCLIGVEANENDPAGTPWLDLTAYQCFTLAVAYVPTGGDLIWANQAGNNRNNIGYGITTLPDNSTVITGYFGGSAVFGEGEPNETALQSPGYYPDIFIARYNPDGTLAWVAQAGGEYEDGGVDITALSDDSTVITGYYAATATFGQGEPNETVLELHPYSSKGDIFIARYNPDGSLAWAKAAGGSREDVGNGITALSDDSTVVTGYFRNYNSDSTIFGLGEPNETHLNSAGDLHMFIARYNSDGTLAWVKQTVTISSSNMGGNGITARSDNSIVATGWFSGQAAFGQGEPNETVLVSSGNKDIFIALYNSDGTLGWAKQAGGQLTADEGFGIAALSDYSTVVVGSFGNTHSGWSSEHPTTFGEGEPNETILISDGFDDIFIARYNPDGSLFWVKQAGSDYEDGGMDISSFTDDSFVVTGWIRGPATFGRGDANEILLDPVGGGWNDIFVARYNHLGSLEWVKYAAGTSHDRGLGVTVLSDDSSVVTGYFSESAIFGPGEPNETELNDYHGCDIFIARFAE